MVTHQIRSKRLETIKTWTSVALAILLGVFVLLQYNNKSIIVVEGEGGTWDLTGVPFAINSVRLSGPVEYVPNALLTPDAFGSSDSVIIGTVPEQCEYLTSRIRLIVPEGQYYEFSGYSDGYGSRLYVNGEWRLDVGRPAEAREGNIATEDYVQLTVCPKDGVIEIVQQASNFVFRKTSPHNQWLIGIETHMKKWTNTLYTMHAITIGLYLMLFLVNFLLYSLIVNHKAMLWLGLLSLVWAIRMCVTGMRPLLTLVPWMNWRITFRIEYCTALAALVLVTLCNREQFPGLISKYLQRTVFITQGAFAVIYLFCDTMLMSRTLPLCVGIGVVCAIWTFGDLLRKRAYKLGIRHRLTMIGLGVIALGLMLDFGYYNNIRIPHIDKGSTETAVYIFAFFQLTAILLLTEEGIIHTQETRAELVLENESLDRVSKLRADMLATFSHEMRTPLAVMMGFAQLTATELRDTKASNQAIRDLDAIADEARRMKQLVDEMHDFSVTRMAKEEMRFLDIGPITTQLCRMYAPIAARKDTAVVMDIEKGLPPVSATTDGLTQVLFNLLNNADRHTRSGEIVVRAKSQGDGVCMTVTDTGSGIDPSEIGRVFDRHHKGVEGGMGMGLTICKELVESWGGEISIESTPGEGTTVRILLSLTGGDTHHGRAEEDTVG